MAVKSSRSIRVRWNDTPESNAQSDLGKKLMSLLVGQSVLSQRPLSSIASVADESEKEYHATITFTTSGQAEKAYKTVSEIEAYKEHFDNDFNGLTLLSSPADCRIDICAIHSLHANVIDTFTGESKLWLRDLLPQRAAFSCARIMLYGYDAGLSESISTPRMTSWADEVLHTVGSFRRNTDHENIPLIFVCYSMGGLVARKAMEHLHQSTDPSEQYPGIRLDQCGLMFLSTPHLGIVQHDYATHVSQHIGGLSDLPKEAILAELQSFNSSVVSSPGIWKSMQNTNVTPPFKCLCESKATIILDRQHEVVGQAAASFLDEQAALIPNTDHIRVCKFDHAYAPGFKIVLQKLTVLCSRLWHPTIFPLLPSSNQIRLPGQPALTAFCYPLRQDQMSYFGASPKSTIGHFHGRNDVLDLLPVQAQLPTETNAVITLSGMGGIGKSEILLEYGRIARKQNHIFHLQAISGQSFDTCVYKLAMAVGSEVLYPKVNLADQEIVWQNYGREQRIDAFLKWLRSPGAGPCIILVDDVDAFHDHSDLESLVEALKSLPYTVVLSTRDPEIGNNIANESHKDSDVHLIDALPEEELTIMMQRFVGSELQFSVVELRTIAQIVAGHPMAACLAIQFVTQEMALDLEQSPIEKFISSFGGDSDDFDTRNRFLHFRPRVGRSLAACLETSIERLGEVQPLASRVLNIAAYLSLPEVDFRTFFLHPRPWLSELTRLRQLPTEKVFELKSAEFKQILRRLVMTSAIAKAGNGNIRIHPLMVEYLLQRQQGPGRLRIIRQIVVLSLTSIQLNEKREVFEKFFDKCKSIARRFQISEADITPPKHVLQRIEGLRTPRTQSVVYTARDDLSEVSFYTNIAGI